MAKEPDHEAHEISYQYYIKNRKQSRPVSTRLKADERAALEKYAIDQDRRISEILNQWVLERMHSEGII